MKLVLLPGLDGTGKLFSPLLSYLNDFQTQIIEYPLSGDQDYETLKNFVIKQLPKDDFIIIAESFSGPIAAMIAQENSSQMKGAIFVATFLSPPKKMLLFFARILPLKIFLYAPLSRHFLRSMFFGKDADDALIKLFIDIIKTVPSSIIKQRLASVSALKTKSFKNEMPAIYIRALSDKFVSEQKMLAFKNYFPNIKFKGLDVEHFLLQSKPNEVAIVIEEFTNSVMR